MSLLSIARLVAINILVTACLLEIVLRAQQALGPWYDLDLRAATQTAGMSDRLNHVPEPDEYWDRDRLRRMEQPNASHCSQKVLFMGDSFMEGVEPTSGGGYLPSRPADTVPVNVRRYFKDLLGKELCVFNAGYASYAPSIYVPQAKILIPLLKPTVVVIDIDETDIVDDYYRYRSLTERDATGSIAAVRPDPVGVRFVQGLLESTSKALYLHRAIAKLYFTRVEFPRFLARYAKGREGDNLFVARLPEPDVRTGHGREIEYFTRTLEDLTQSIVSRMGGPDGLIYIHHPHLQHLGTAGPEFNTIVADTVRDVASRHGVRFYDATADLKEMFGGDAQKYYVRADMHFNGAGTRAYAIAVARYLAEAIRDK